MTNEQLEFAISQYLDGTLPAEERGALERLLETSADARRLLEEYRSLDGLLKQAPPPPPSVHWNNLAAAISGAVARDAAASAEPLTEAAEYNITQYIDGDLPADDVPAVEAMLALNAAARAAEREYRSLDGLVKRAMPLPDVKWDRLAEHIAEAVDDEATRSRYSLTWLRAAPRIAMAACLMLVLALAVYFYMSGLHETTTNAVAEIIGPAPDSAAGQPIVQVNIDVEASEIARGSFDEFASDVVVATPARIQLASTSVNHFDGGGGSFPY